MRDEVEYDTGKKYGGLYYHRDGDSVVHGLDIPVIEKDGVTVSGTEAADPNNANDIRFDFIFAIRTRDFDEGKQSEVISRYNTATQVIDVKVLAREESEVASGKLFGEDGTVEDDFRLWDSEGAKIVVYAALDGVNYLEVAIADYEVGKDIYFQITPATEREAWTFRTVTAAPPAAGVVPPAPAFTGDPIAATNIARLYPLQDSTPPARVKGVDFHPNQFLIIHDDEQVYFSGVNQFTFFPRDTAINIPHGKVLGVIEYRRMIIICPEHHQPLFASVTSPAPGGVSLATPEIVHPCVSGDSLARVSGGVIYASADGLVMLSSAGGASLLTIESV